MFVRRAGGDALVYTLSVALPLPDSLGHMTRSSMKLVATHSGIAGAWRVRRMRRKEEEAEE